MHASTGYMANIIEVFNKSKSDPTAKPYTTVLDANGRLGCDCRGWTVLKKEADGVTNKPRRCTHTDDLVKHYNLSPVAHGDYLYVRGVTKGKVPLLGNTLPKTSPVKKAKAKPTIKAEAAPSKPAKSAVITVGGIRIIDLDNDDDVHVAPVRVPAPVAPPTPSLPPPFDFLSCYVDPMLADSMKGLANPKIATVLAALDTYDPLLWVLEEKFDGHRVIVVVQDGNVRAFSRPKSGKLALQRDLPYAIRTMFATFPNGTYDGELYVPGGTSTDVTEGSNTDKLKFVVFDLPRLLGNNICGQTLRARRDVLVELFKHRMNPFIHLAEQVPPSAEWVRNVFDRGGEGAILKRMTARYQPASRSADWIKVKGIESCVMEVIGFKKGKLGPYSRVEVWTPVDDTTTIVKTLDNAALAAFAADPESCIGRKLRIEYQIRTRDGGYRHPRWDRWEKA